MRCPATGGRLEFDGSARLTAAGVSRSYPIVRGVPILVVEERSLFSPDDYVDEDVVAGRSGTPAGRLVHAVGRRLPALSPNVGTDDNLAELAEQVRALVGGRRARVLVVGGAVDGVGFPSFRAGLDDAEIISVDAAFGPSTDVVCDAHDLPFEDSVFDAVVCQAVLEHVADPQRVVSEIHRVLRPGGLVYSEVPFLQPVHAGAYDFTRFTQVGHRRLYRCFDELRSGAQGGPASALAWSLAYFARAVMPTRPLRLAAFAATAVMVSWLRHLDRFLVGRRAGIDAASGTFFLGRRRDSPVDDREVIASYRDESGAFHYDRC